MCISEIPFINLKREIKVIKTIYQLNLERKTYSALNNFSTKKS